jgi:hypothetical protein
LLNAGVGLMEELRPEDPQWVGRYRLLKRLGTGGMGRVYLGQSPSGRHVAVKIIRAELADNADFRQRFRQEVKAARRVGGIFTAPVVDADPDAPQPWMVTAFVSGPSLAEAVASRGPMPVGTVLILAAGLAEGLSSVHAAGLVHRDLKPSNVLLASDGPRIIDFGVARSSETMGPTKVGGVIGSPGFMSPEQAAGEPVGPPSDIFSLGGVLAYAATGEPPFGDGPPSALLYRVVHGEAAIGNVPLELRRLVAHCLLSDPAARPTTDQLLGQLGQAAPVQGWLEWQATSEEPTWHETGEEPAGQPPNTVSSAAWGRGAVIADQPADEMPAGPAGPAAHDDDGLPAVPADVVLPAVPADVVLAGMPERVSDVSAAGSGPPGFVASDPGRAEALPPDAVAGATPLSPSPAGSMRWLFPDPSDAPSGAATPAFRDGRRRRASLAAVCVLGVVILVALALWLVPRLDPNPPTGLGVGAPPSAQPTSPSPQGRAPRTPGADAPSADISSGASTLSASEMGTARVVVDFFAAISDRRWDLAWALGGDHLYASTDALEAAWAHVSQVHASILGVRGHTVLARITATNLDGTGMVLTQAFVVNDGAIVSRENPPPGAAG